MLCLARGPLDATVPRPHSTSTHQTASLHTQYIVSFHTQNLVPLAFTSSAHLISSYILKFRRILLCILYTFSNFCETEDTRL